MIRRDYSASELDERPLIMLRTFAPTVLIWTGPRAQTLNEYLDARIARHKEETKGR